MEINNKLIESILGDHISEMDIWQDENFQCEYDALVNGITEELKKRTTEHNPGKSPHTSKYAPWQPVVAVLFSNHAKARAFEQ